MPHHTASSSLDEPPTLSDHAAGFPADLDQDIYRGSPPPAGATRSRADSVSSSSSSSSTSSTSSSSSGGKLGAIAAVVEQAISRWARGHASTSSLDSSVSSSSLASTLRTFTRTSLSRRRRRQSSVASLHNLQQEREIQARMRARQQAKYTPREFTLYLPTSLRFTPEETSEDVDAEDDDRVFRTTSLPLVTVRLDAVMKNLSKHHRGRPSKLAPRQSKLPQPMSMMTPPVLRPNLEPSNGQVSMTDLGTIRRSRKGKGKERETATSRYTRQMMEHHWSSVSPLLPVLQSSLHSVSRVVAPQAIEKAWWLDVASPTSSDMRAIGNLLHLHPLTLEDILQQEPHEKLELFPRLGYYFIAFRAMQGRKSSNRLKPDTLHPPGTDPYLIPEEEGIIGEAMVYLVVFREGVCTFHFSDISEHIDRVRSRALMFEKTQTMSSDWVAHGIIDSIVDSFFPLLAEIEKEVLAIEDITFSNEGNLPSESPRTKKVIPSPVQEEVSPSSEKMSDSPLLEEKGNRSATPVTRLPLVGTTRTHFDLQGRPIRLTLRRVRRYIRKGISRFLHTILPWFASTVGRHPRDLPPISPRDPVSEASAATLRRMSRTRRLVTTLSRLLATKSDVVARIQKRLLTQVQGEFTTSPPIVGAPTHEIGAVPLGNSRGMNASDDVLSNLSKRSEAIEVAIYYGDVQDHIITLHQTLNHLERMLSHSQPTYLTFLRVMEKKASQRTDKAILMLSCITVGIYCIQPSLGIFGMNCHVPGKSSYLAICLIIAGICVETCVYLAVIRRWYLSSKRKRWATLE